MMNLNSDRESIEMAACLIFSLNQLDFAVEVSSVREIVWLPKLTPVEEVPHYVAGVLNLRGFVVPIIDLNRRFGHASQPYLLANKVVVLEHDKRLVGMIVDDVTDVVEVNRLDIAETPLADQKKRHRSSYICGEMKLGESIIMLLSAEAICELELDDDVEHESGEEPMDQLFSQYRTFCPDASDEEQQVFQQRARELMVSLEDENESSHKMVAVIGISKELFGVELDLIREFTEIGHVVPIPCVPRHIVGDMNLRGEILTVVDIKGLIGVPERSGIRAAKLIVTAMDGQIIGIPIDEVHDLIRIDSAMGNSAGNENYLKRTVEYNNQMLGILDLEQIMVAEELVVDEVV